MVLASALPFVCRTMGLRRYASHTGLLRRLLNFVVFLFFLYSPLLRFWYLSFSLSIYIYIYTCIPLFFILTLTLLGKICRMLPEEEESSSIYNSVSAQQRKLALGNLRSRATKLNEELDKRTRLVVKMIERAYGCKVRLRSALSFFAFAPLRSRYPSFSSSLSHLFTSYVRLFFYVYVGHY